MKKESGSQIHIRNYRKLLKKIPLRPKTRQNPLALIHDSHVASFIYHLKKDDTLPCM